MNSHDPIFFAPPPTEIPDYVWSPRYDRPCYIPGRPTKQPKDIGVRIPHPDAETALQAAKRACRKKPGRWFGRSTSGSGQMAFLVYESSKVIERQVVAQITEIANLSIFIRAFVVSSAGKAFRRLADIIDESVIAFVLGRNLVNFKRSRISNYIHRPVWSGMPVAALPYSVWSIVYLIAAYQSLSQINALLHTFFMVAERCSDEGDGSVPQ